MWCRSSPFRPDNKARLQVTWGELGIYLGSLFSLLCYFTAPRDSPPEGNVMVVSQRR